MMIRTRKKYKKNDIGVECRKCGRHEDSTEHVPTTYCTYCSQSTVQDFSWLLYQFTVYYCCGFGLIIIFFVCRPLLGIWRRICLTLPYLICRKYILEKVGRNCAVIYELRTSPPMHYQICTCTYGACQVCQNNVLFTLYIHGCAYEKYEECSCVV